MKPSSSAPRLSLRKKKKSLFEISKPRFPWVLLGWFFYVYCCIYLPLVSAGSTTCSLCANMEYGSTRCRCLNSSRKACHCHLCGFLLQAKHFCKSAQLLNASLPLSQCTQLFHFMSTEDPFYFPLNKKSLQLDLPAPGACPC